jgi:hypothetical protein
MQRNRILASSILPMLFLALAAHQERSVGQTAPLPAGHPPIGGQGSGSEIATPPPVAEHPALTWTVPAKWAKETPGSSMRLAQYSIPGAAGAGECAVFYFGPGQGGDAQSNAVRWAGQFRRPDGTPIGDAFKTREIKVGDISVLMVEVSGTYVGGMGGTPSGPDRPNEMLLGAIAKGPDANWFFRAIGPQATMEAQREAFEGMIRSLKRAEPQ